MMPIILPNVAPIAIEGTKIPAGTLHPYEITTKPVRMTVARNNELTMCHCTDVLEAQRFIDIMHTEKRSLTGIGHHSHLPHHILETEWPCSPSYRFVRNG